MIRMQGEVVIGRPVEEVFDYVADARNEPTYNRLILWVEKDTAGPIGLGTKFRNRTKGVGGITEWEIELAEYQRSRQLTLSLHSSAMDTRGVLMFEPVSAGTELNWIWDVSPRGILKLFTPLLRRNGQRLEENNWENFRCFMERKQ